MNIFKPLIEGFFLQASLIFALGAQNIFVLESGIKRSRPFLVATICSLCDFLLVGIGVLGAGTLFVKYPILKILVGIVGVGFLIIYGFKKIIHHSQFSLSTQNTEHSIKDILISSLAFSLLNPHVYLDTVVLIGGYSSKFTLMMERIYFGLGASSFSILWFFSLVLITSNLSQLFQNKKAMRIISIVAGCILIFLSFKLGHDVWIWINNYSDYHQ